MKGKYEISLHKINIVTIFYDQSTAILHVRDQQRVHHHVNRYTLNNHLTESEDVRPYHIIEEYKRFYIIKEKINPFNYLIIAISLTPHLPPNIVDELSIQPRLNGGVQSKLQLP